SVADLTPILRAIVVFALSSLAVSAQNPATRFEVSGVVLDPSGAVIPKCQDHPSTKGRAHRCGDHHRKRRVPAYRRPHINLENSAGLHWYLFRFATCAKNAEA